MEVEEFIKYVKENYDMYLTVKPSETPDNFDKLFFTNDSCKNCSNNPKNGGSGICCCTLGSQVIS